MLDFIHFICSELTCSMPLILSCQALNVGEIEGCRSCHRISQFLVNVQIFFIFFSLKFEPFRIRFKNISINFDFLKYFVYSRKNLLNITLLFLINNLSFISVLFNNYNVQNIIEYFNLGADNVSFVTKLFICSISNH